MEYVIRQTEEFATWLRDVRDVHARVAIARRLDRAAFGNLGDVKPIREGVSEMRVDIGKGYRLYFIMRGGVMIVLLCGGDKKTQRTDIRCAIQLAKEY
jgi:putative addiction module killer protein